jgi:hypothetical protein
MTATMMQIMYSLYHEPSNERLVKSKVTVITNAMVIPDFSNSKFHEFFEKSEAEINKLDPPDV